MKNIGNRPSARLRNASACIMLIVILLSLTGALLLNSRAGLDIGPVTGAIWTTDPHGERVNGNLYINPRRVHLAGGPHRKGAAGLPDGVYYFQVTDPAGKQLLSDDDPSDRMFTVENGYITRIDPPGTHDSNPDTTRDCGIVVQLWPFRFTPNKGGAYKVWVTHFNHYTEGEGCFGFIPSLSKTDNFKVKVDEEPKYFEIWVTDRISKLPDVGFYVNYTIDSDGDPNTHDDPLLPWTTEQLIHDGTVNGYDVFRDETSFAMGTYIYWVFFARRVLNAFEWTSVMYGPELIDREGMVNKEILFVVGGHNYDYRDSTGLEGWTIELYKDDEIIDDTTTDADGYYELIGVGTGDFRVCEVSKFDEGWANATPSCYDFTVDGNNGGDLTFDFYNYKMLRLTDTSECRCELWSFDVVFTPSNEEPGKYKLSSTNPGSFYINVVKYGTAGKPVTIEIDLPPPQENDDYDFPNFILHHAYIGSTPELDVHVYAGRLESPCSEMVPDWSKNITNLFNITEIDEKHVTVEGIMPDSGEVFVTVHIDYQISASLTGKQVEDLTSTFEYTFSDMVYFSGQGVTIRISVR